MMLKNIFCLPHRIMIFRLVFCALGLAGPGNLFRLAAQTTQPVVAIHDSELTRALELMPAAPPTPAGSGATGFQWWPADWHYFVLPESMQEALRSDGTAFTVIGDSNITAGLLLPNGAPKFPIVISLASEAIRNDEIAPLTNYVAAGGFLLIGSSAFTRNPDGSPRGDFAFPNELGLHTWAPGLTNWESNSGLTRRLSHRLVSHLPDGTLYWRMPNSAEEVNWGLSPSHQFLAPHDVWRTYPVDATVLAQGDDAPYLAVKPFGKGYFIYAAAFQPLIGHGGFAPGMYAYVIFRNAIEWAYESARLPIARLGPWPYAYDAAFMVRHDLENFPAEIANIEASAQVERNLGAKGDYYFCTGTLRQDMAGGYDTNAVIASLQRAVGQYGATIGPHNGGLRNPFNASLSESEYDFWHWGLDEALDTAPAGYANGKAYAQASLSISFSDVENWLPGLMTPDFRVWVAPYFNATREDSYDIQAQLGVKVAGEQKLTPFPHWTLSTRVSGKRFPFLSQPVSDWFVGGLVAQSLEPWHPPGVHTSSTMHEAVDFYYRLGALINVYSHTLSTGQGDAGQLVPDYLSYCLNTNLHPRLWSANAIDIYHWWVRRSTTSLTATYATNGSQATASISVSRATDPDASLEVSLPSRGTITGLEVRTNGVLAGANTFRMAGQTVKIRVGTSTNAQVRYILSPEAVDDFYPIQQGVRANVSAPGVLANDSPGLRPNLAAVSAGAPNHGALTLSSNGGFSYLPDPGFSGTDSFTYRATDGFYTSPAATVFLMVNAAGTLFADDFSSSTDPASIDPWTVQNGNWLLTGGVMEGRSAAGSYGNAYYDAASWTDYTVQAQVRFSSANGYGGGLGGRLNSANGAHYGAWVFPEGSPGGPAILRLIKFEGWTSWSFAPMQAVNLPAVGTNWHSLALTFQGSNIGVLFDGVPQINGTDNNFDSLPPYLSGGITADLYSDNMAYALLVDDVLVRSTITPPVITTQPASVTTNLGSTVSFSVSVSGPEPVNFAWMKDGTNYLNNGGKISGAASRTLTVTAVSSVDAGSYAVLVSNPGGSVTSAPAALKIVAPNPPVIVSQPQSQSVIAGNPVSFSVSATGGAPLHYQWRFKGVNLAGATSSTLNIPNPQGTNAGQYTVIVSNTDGAVASAPATLSVSYSLTVTASRGGSVTVRPASTAYAPGSSVSLKAQAQLGYDFIGWTGNANGTANPLSVTMNSNEVIHANFKVNLLGRILGLL